MTFVGADNPQHAFLTQNQTKCCEVEAANYFDAMEYFYRHLGWKPYKRPDDWQECLDIAER